MVNVTVVFTSGTVVNLVAQEFDANLGTSRQLVNKYPYKDSGGQHSVIHLKPDDVAGVFVTPAGRLLPSEQTISYTVAQRK
jgi:hypothetical protein